MSLLLRLPTLALLLAALFAALIATVQAYVFEVCDPKLGCSAGIQVVALFAAVLGLLGGLVVAFGWLGTSAVLANRLNTRVAYFIASIISLGVALWSTSAGWGTR